jgi:hypothetical protein
MALVTKLGAAFLNVLARDLYMPANGGYPTDVNDVASAWTFSVADTWKAQGRSARSMGGVVARLAEMKLVTVGGSGVHGDDSFITMTDAGFAAWRSLFPTEAESDAALSQRA